MVMDLTSMVAIPAPVAAAMCTIGGLMYLLPVPATHTLLSSVAVMSRKERLIHCRDIDNIIRQKEQLANNSTCRPLRHTDLQTLIHCEVDCPVWQQSKEGGSEASI